ncbi:ABC transporter permease [Maribacter cobaltidurans]|uniref:Cell division protein FtsX n=1 Tax=Maribacter cobaltidurans TaxID=1178778 RepID=A0A223V554_9FLAO|nr:ABC transporter permease [Maribacter cobaltidurans]ASV30545.1 cell division protein FtsX [Maribacter cobaltidurans]GGD79614.1 ABC transporter permease [Maribacter cobaltidurans]
MFKNHIKIAWRSLKKQPFFTFLNTFGLAIGMTGALLISLYIYDELGYDKMFADVERIHRLNADIKFGGQVEYQPEVSAPMAEAILNDISQVEAATRFRSTGATLIKKSGEVNSFKEPRTTYAETSMFSLLGLELLHGDASTALDEPNTAVISQTLAQKLFSTENAIGKSIDIDVYGTYTVSGVIPDLPKNSFLQERNLFLSMAGYPDAREGAWGSHNYYTLIKLKKGIQPNEIYPGLNAMVGKYVIPFVQSFFPGITLKQFEESGNYIKYSTIPLTDIHLHSNRSPEFSPNGNIQNLYILGAIGIFLIILASINFMNLSTAQSLKRAKEVGVRKTLGSGRSGLIRQFLTESGLISFGSLLVAVILSTALLPVFNQLSGKNLEIPFTNPLFLLLLVIATLILGFLSGSYPALFMSRFVPVKVLKGTGDQSLGGSRTRNILVIFQFAVSVLLIIATLVVYQQLNFIKGKDLGYAKDQVLVVDDVYLLGNKRQVFKKEIEGLTQIEHATLSSFLPTPSNRSDSSFLLNEDRSQEKAVQMQEWQADYDYVKTIGLELVAGRDFDPRFGTDSTAILVNETTVKKMNSTPTEVLGRQLVELNQGRGESIYTIIGVVKNFNFETLHNEIDALGIFPSNNAGRLAIKLGEGDLNRTLAQIEGVWNQMAVGKPFSYHFMDDSFNQSYEAEQRLGTIFMIFTMLSILIACLGLFGLAAFNAQKRVKEIGVRKVLGAIVGQITYRLSMDFLKLVFVSILVALPLGWFVMNRWLQDFAYRIDLPWWVLFLAAFMAVAIALITVSWQSLKAAMANPVKSLRTE